MLSKRAVDQHLLCPAGAQVMPVKGTEELKGRAESQSLRRNCKIIPLHDFSETSYRKSDTNKCCSMSNTAPSYLDNHMKACNELDQATKKYWKKQQNLNTSRGM
jgi:hypothetical protein